jgi:uncharacterized protein YjbJ (UPF0337 family)
MIGRGIFYR